MMRVMWKVLIVLEFTILSYKNGNDYLTRAGGGKPRHTLNLLNKCFKLSIQESFLINIGFALGVTMFRYVRMARFYKGGRVSTEHSRTRFLNFSNFSICTLQHLKAGKAEKC